MTRRRRLPNSGEATERPVQNLPDRVGKHFQRLARNADLLGHRILVRSGDPERGECRHRCDGRLNRRRAAALNDHARALDLDLHGSGLVDLDVGEATQSIAVGLGVLEGVRPHHDGRLGAAARKRFRQIDHRLQSPGFGLDGLPRMLCRPSHLLELGPVSIGRHETAVDRVVVGVDENPRAPVFSVFASEDAAPA